MTDKPINLDDFRPKPEHEYPDPEPIEAAAESVAAYAGQITQISVEKHGAVDLIAHDLCIRANDLLRLAHDIRAARTAQS